jgi:HNH endonuclease
MPNQLHKSRQLAFNLQSGRCYYFGVAMLPPGTCGPRAIQCTAEHLLPRSEGGSDGPSNVVAACAHCNQTRHKRKVPPAPDAYRAEVRRRLQRGKWHNKWVHRQGLLPGTGHAPEPKSGFHR